jgi:hypothetical protein
LTTTDKKGKIMDKQILCRAYRRKTKSWLSLVVPELENRKDKVVWVKEACGDQFMPEEMKHIPIDIIDMMIEALAMETEPRKNNGPDSNDSWPEDGGPDFV